MNLNDARELTGGSRRRERPVGQRTERPAAAGAAPLATPAGANGAGNSDVLAKFFNSMLLPNGPGRARTPPAGSASAASRSGRADPAQELGKYQGKAGDD